MSPFVHTAQKNHFTYLYSCLRTHAGLPRQEWATLNETISGCLIHTVPLASVCYQSEPNYRSEACNAVLANWTSSAFHAADPASVGDLTWTNSSCLPIYPNGTSIGGDPNAGEKGCSMGNFSPYVVNATEAGHVLAALKFAEEHNLRFNGEEYWSQSREKVCLYKMWNGTIVDILFAN